MIFEYDESENMRLLEAIDPKARVVFALLCATRMLPAYRRFHEVTGRGDPSRIEALAETLWSLAAGEEPVLSSIRDAVDEAEQLVPSEEDGWDERTQPYAEDAAAALAYAFRAELTSQPQEAAWAGRRAYEAVDHYVRNLLQWNNEARILSHPLVQAELARQRRDLLHLATLDAHMITDAAPILRRRAVADAPLVFGAVP